MSPDWFRICYLCSVGGCTTCSFTARSIGLISDPVGVPVRLSSISEVLLAELKLLLSLQKVAHCAVGLDAG